MSNIFIVYDTNGNITQATTNYPQVTPPSQMLVCDPVNTPNAQNALTQPSHYMVQNGSIIPAVTLTVTRTAGTPSGNFNIVNLQITASDNADHTVTLQVLNDTETLNVPASGLTYQIAIHQSLANAPITANLSATGVVSFQQPIGGTGSLPSCSLQAYKDSNGLLHIAPSGVGSKAFLVNYWTQVVVNALADLGTIDGILTQVVFGIILPALTSGSTPLVTLDDNQKNAVADIQTNVIPNIPVTLENAAPKPVPPATQTFDLHYASYRRHIAQMNTAMTNYGNDVSNIPNLA